MTFEQQIGMRITKLRRMAGMKQKDLARQLNVTASTISHYESGTNVPNVSILVSIAEIFGVSADYILGQTNLCMDWQTFRRDITLMDGTVISLESVINHFLSLSEQNQADICRLIHLFQLEDRLRRKNMESEENDFDAELAEKMMHTWLHN